MFFTVQIICWYSFILSNHQQQRACREELEHLFCVAIFNISLKTLINLKQTSSWYETHFSDTGEHLNLAINWFNFEADKNFVKPTWQRIIKGMQRLFLSVYCMLSLYKQQADGIDSHDIRYGSHRNFGN
jgi:hypothetical protein